MTDKNQTNYCHWSSRLPVELGSKHPPTLIKLCWLTTQPRNSSILQGWGTTQPNYSLMISNFGRYLGKEFPKWEHSMASCVRLTAENLNCMMMIMVTQLKELGYQFKTKSIRKLSNFNFQWIKPCTRIILFKQYPWPFFKIFKDYRRI